MTAPHPMKTLALVALVAFAACHRQPAAPASVPRTLRVVLYPFIPQKDAVFAEVRARFAQRHPDIALELVDLESNYYDSAEAGSLVGTRADVYEIDAVLLADFVAAGRLQPIDEGAPASDYLAPAARAVVFDGQRYAVPRWVCSNFLFFPAAQPLEDVASLRQLEAALGTGKLLIDLKGRGTLGELYLDAEVDRRSALDAATAANLNADAPAVRALRRVHALCPAGRCRSVEDHRQAGAYARRFARGEALAFAGYFEALHAAHVESAAAESGKDALDLRGLELASLPLADEGSQPVGWVDALGIDVACTGRCAADARAFIAFLDSEDELLRTLLPEGQAPRYLLPARESLYRNARLLGAVPLYEKALPIVRRMEVPVARGLNERLRRIGGELDRLLPQ